MLEDNFDYINICRLCAKFTMSLYSLYEIDVDGVSSIEKLKVICGLDVNENDNFPKTICKKCRKKLRKYYEFQNMCLTSQTLLKTSRTVVDYEEEQTEQEEIQYFIEIEESQDVNTGKLKHADIKHFFKNNKKLKTQKNSKNSDANKIHKCKVCKKRFSTELRVKLHMQRIHKQIYLSECKVSCPKCGMKFQQMRNLKRHLVYHNNNDSYFACQFCEIKTYSKKSWRKHVKTHDEKINVICKICNKNILSKLANIYHMEFHHTKEVLNKKTFYFCETCQKDFTEFANLENHCIENHSLTLPKEHDYLTTEKSAASINASIIFKCNICNRLYKNLQGLKSHVEECYAKVNRPKIFMCDVCGKCFPSAWTLSNHTVGHSNRRPFVCDKCGQTFKWHNDLSNHRARIHEHFRPYVCKICGKTCGTSATLKSHQRLHTGEKPFACSLCGARFAQSSSLKEHALKHAGGAAAACPECAKVFQTPLRLRMHLKRHNTQRPLHPCTQCHRLFTEKSSVRKHLLNIHSSQ